MKVYKFFKIPDRDDDEFNIEKKYTLYAITNNKEYAKRFKEDRNMDKFIYKVNKGVTVEEYAEMCNIERNAVLEFRSLDTVYDDNHTRQNIKSVNVLMTYWEKQLIDEPNTLLDDEESWRGMPCPILFKPKYQEVLTALQYTTFYKLMTAEYLPYKIARKLSSEDDDYAAPSILYDEVALFIKIIQDTL